MPQNFRVVLKSRPGVSCEPQESNFHHEECAYPLAQGETMKEGQVLVRTLCLSVDPALRCRMNEETGVAYMSPWGVGKAILGLGGVGQVVESAHPDYVPGEVVQGSFSWPWQTYFIWPDANNPMELSKVDRSLVGDQPSLILTVLGLVGLTSLIGLREKGQLTAGANETVVISGAAGACGSLAGQIARLDGAGQVVGICGTAEKCDYLRGLGFDAAICYRTEDVASRLREACPQGVDVYFDNVGGEISEAVISQMVHGGRVVLCGQISTYNSDLPYPPPISPKLERIISERQIKRERFLVLNYPEQFEPGLRELGMWLTQGKIKARETVADGLENAGKAFVSMMKGGNIGKQIVQVSQLQA